MRTRLGAIVILMLGPAGEADRRPQGRVMRLVGLIAAVLLLAISPAADAQPAKQVPRIGILCAVGCPPVPLEVPAGRALLQGLREAGYVVGENILLDHRASGGGYEGLAGRAAELVRRKVDVILALGDVAVVRAGKQATRTVPIVMVSVGDAVQLGLVASLARPGGNLTGVTVPLRQLATKQLELLKDVVPGVSRVAVLANPANPEHGPALQELESAARALRIQIQILAVQRADEFEGAFSAMRRERADAFLVLEDPTFTVGRSRLVAFALELRVPAVSLDRVFVQAAGLMAYGPDPSETFRRAAALVRKILEGAKPADLPVEEPTRYQLVINLTTARALGLAVPQSILLRADEVIR